MKRAAPARASAGILLLVAAGPAIAATTLVGAKGERLSGTLVERSDGYIVFDSDSFGRLRVRADQVRIEERASPVAAAARGPWSTDISLKFGVDRGSLKTPEDDLDATFRFVHTSSRGELHGSVDYNYKRTDGVLKDDDLTASLSYDRLLADRRFIAGRVLGASELTTEGYDRTETVSLAYGWRFGERDDRYLRLGPALGYLAMDRGDRHFGGAAFGLYLRAKGPLFKRITYASELQVLDALDNGRYANLDFRLQHPLGEHLYLALAWNYVWSDVDIESGITSEWRWVLGWRSQPEEGH